MRVSFRARVAALLLALFAVVLLPTFVAFYYAIRQSALSQAEQRVVAGGRVFNQAVQARGERLRREVQVLTSDFGFKRAVASGDSATIRTALYNHGQRIHADLVVLSSLDGTILASIEKDGKTPDLRGWSELLNKARRDDGLSVSTPLAGAAYQLVLVPLRAPTRMAWVGMGFALDNALAASLKELTQLDISFAAESGGTSAMSSTLPPQQRQALEDRLHAIAGDTSKPRLVQLGEREYFSLWQPLDRASGEALGAYLQYPLARALAPFQSLRHELVLIALLSLVAAMIGAIWLARSVTRPVLTLAAAARRIEKGDYPGEIRVARRDELGKLARAFESMQSGIAERERRIAHQAQHDALTGLCNRAGLDEILRKAIARAAARNSAMAVLMLDLDRFKEINDTMGHALGDRVLAKLAQRLCDSLPQSDVVARFGGDEFVVLLDDIVDGEDAARRSADLSARLHRAFTVDDIELYLDISIGVAMYPEHGGNAEELLRRADIAMYEAKQGHGSISIYESGRDAAHLYRLSLIHDLRGAIAGHELTVHYQPKIRIDNGRVTHVEALVRWQHPQHGSVSPEVFIPLAEHSGAIRDLTEWVLGEVVAQCRVWNDQGLDMGVAINLSAMDLGTVELPDLLATLLAQHEVDAARLVLEITETAIMRDAVQSLEVLNRLKRCGVRLSIDDFGTGYSSLSLLKRLPVDELKIDKSFVLNMANDEDDVVIVRSTIELAHNMGLTVVAEGVEDQGSLGMLRLLECDMAQGYLISRPMPAAACSEWMAQYSRRSET